MSAWLDYTGGDGPGGLGSEDLYTGGVGYATDGTFTVPSVAVTAAPVDAGGGPAGNYGGAVLDIFKMGVGVWNQQQQQKAMLDYKRYEATQYGAFMQGQPALAFGRNGQVLGSSSGITLLVLGFAAILLLKGK